ncbi:hypothetical protein [Paracoccus contaminans]|uniref:YIP1 family protein n=1 Tax=Paracoccus contaminans TaxID=1945662 RepID=A0A1W6CY83_9RHOB|nr:hypothetical protein [Paracoccus contaminans]ARJ69806.1 hypothetical protein B0A89_09425 [Paracoccus contaminans]
MPAERQAPRGLVGRLARAWTRPLDAARGLADLPEPAVLALLLGTMVVYFMAQWPGHARSAALDPSVPMQARLGGALLATMFIMPLVVMAVAALAALAIRALGGRIEGRHSRIALVWALAAAAPVMLLGGLTQGLIGPGAALTLVHAAAGAAFVIFWAAGLRAFVRRGPA